MAEIRNAWDGSYSYGQQKEASNIDQDPLIRVLSNLTKQVYYLEIEVEKLKAAQNTNLQL